MQNPPIVRDVLLLGGGHSHVIVIRMWAMKQIPGVRVTLVSRDAMTPYSGMLPGLVAGHYSFTDSHIDLNRLCRFAGVRFVQATVTGLVPDQRRVNLEGRPDIEYDILSIDTGGAPNLDRPPRRPQRPPSPMPSLPRQASACAKCRSARPLNSHEKCKAVPHHAAGKKKQ